MNSFLIEMFNRLFKSRSPEFFIRMQIIAGCLTVANYIPSMLQRWLDVSVPGGMINLCEDIAKYSAGYLAASFLPTKTKPVAQTLEGQAVMVTDEKKLPFTAKSEAKEVIKAEPPVPVVTDVQPELNEIPKRE